ncbi:MAG TPA: insulinase family protein, partial [Labilithrix sp.]
MRRAAILALALAASACSLGRSFTSAKYVDDLRPARRVSTFAAGDDGDLRAKPPPPLPRKPRPHVEPVEKRLSNGVRVVMVERHDFPIVSFVMVLDRGADDAPAGVASVYADALAGTSDKYDANEAFAYLRYFGVELRTWTTRSAVLLQATSLTPLWGSALSRTAPMFAKPALTSKDLDRARALVAAEAAHELTDGHAIASQRALAELFGASDPRGAPEAGRSPEAVQAIGQGAVESFRDMYLSADRVTVVAVGDFKSDKMIGALERALGGLAKKRAASGEAHETAPDAHGGRIVVVDRPGAVQSNVAIAWGAPAPGDPDATALEVLAKMTGGGLSSRLNLTVRKELGASYGVHMTVSPRRAGGSVLLTAAIDTPRTSDALGGILAELERLGREPPSRAELAAAKNQAIDELYDGNSAAIARFLARAA